MDRESFSDPAVQKFLRQNTIAIHIDAAQHPELVSRYQVLGYPTFVFVNADGDEVGRIVGYVPRQQFLAKASQIAQ
jgi:thioredoxin-related protein